MTFAALLTFASWWLACAEDDGSRAPRADLDNGVIARSVEWPQGRLRTTSLRRKSPPRELLAGASSPEFELVLQNGVRLTADDYRVNDPIEPSEKRDRVELSLTPHDPTNPRVRVEFRAGPGDGWIRKKLHVDGTKVVVQCIVESLAIEGPGESLGLGQPAFIDREWHAGLEHPAGENQAAAGALRCWHHPGRAQFESPWCEIGGRGDEATIEQSFARYVRSFCSPIAPLIQYNAWFDRREEESRPEVFLETFHQFEEQLLRPHGLTLDMFVLDDGWQAGEGIWKCGPRWPQGLRPFGEALERSGSRLGLWLTLNGYRTNTAWGAKQGFELTDHSKRVLCLAGPRYHQALQNSLLERIADGNVGFLKHDFNYLQCSADGHGHLPTAPCGREANVDAQLAILGKLREKCPGLLQSLTSNIWPSPWWLAQADFLWIGGPDLDRDWDQPTEGARWAEMTARDERLYQLLRRERAQVPLSRLMTHGVIRGRHEGITAGESLREWSDYVVWQVARGTKLHELYISPELMPAAFWPVLGKALAWGKAESATFADSSMIGGRPANGEPYGFLHRGGGKLLVAIRNPSPAPRPIRIEIPRCPSGGPWHPIVIYPYRERYAPFNQEATTIELAGHQTLIIELATRAPSFLRETPPGRFDLMAEGGAEIVEYANPAQRIETVAAGIGYHRRWEGELEIRGASQERRLTFLTKPGSAVAAAARWNGHSASADRFRPPKPADWERTSFTIPAEGNGRLELSAWLPRTPWASHRAEVTVLLEVVEPLAERRRSALTSADALPIWPAAIEAGVARRTIAIDEGVVLRRRYSARECFGWVMALGVAPLMGATWLTEQLVRSLTGWRRFLAGATALAILTWIYLQTPLPIALARVLT